MDMSNMLGMSVLCIHEKSQKYQLYGCITFDHPTVQLVFLVFRNPGSDPPWVWRRREFRIYPR